MSNLKQKYNKDVLPALKKKFGYKNDLSVPKINKVTVNIGIGQGLKDAKFIETAENTLKKITGQQPVKTKAKKAISNFKIREGMTVGMKVTLRKNRMYDFLDKLINATLPRIRDFRGLPSDAFDGKGNYSIGFKEHLAFPEISADEVEKLHGLEVAISTTAKNDEEGRELLALLGFPFKK